jgi:hypothetical protein
VAEAKSNVRNMLVYFNHLVLKLAVNNPHLQQASSGNQIPTQPQDSDNAKSHLAKMVPDVKKLLEWL